MLGVIDRIEEDYAVILIEQTKEEKIIHKDYLPQNLQEGMWIKITRDETGKETFTIDEQTTIKQREKVNTLREQLLNRQKKNK